MPNDRLDEIIATMDVPIGRIHDLGWLQRNLAFRNRNHRDFAEAMKIILVRLRDEDRGAPFNYEHWRTKLGIPHHHVDDRETNCYEDHHK